MFEVGQSYKNTIGTYEVLAIRNDKIEVRYTDGHTQTLSVATQTRICQNRAKEQEYISKSPKAKRHINYDYSSYWTLGFLLARLTHLQHKVQYDKQDEARNRYFEETGEELDAVKTGVFYYPKGTNQWGNQGVITFYANESELSLLKFKGTPRLLPSSLSIYEVSDLEYFYFMVRNGFRADEPLNNDKIISSIPVANKDAFDKGYTFASSNIKAKTITP